MERNRTRDEMGRKVPRSLRLFGIDLSLVAQNKNYRVSTQEHFADKPILVDWLLVLTLRDFRPHLFDVFKYHITVAIKGLYPSEKLFVISQRNENLGMVADRLLQN